jgi:hypothetical protein
MVALERVASRPVVFASPRFGWLWEAGWLAARRASLWVIGLLGFLVRGGLLLLALLVVPVPSPVALSTFIGPDLIDTQALSARFQAELVATAVIATVIVWLALVLSAAADRAAFARMVADPASLGLRAGRTARMPIGRARVWLVMQLALLQAIVLLPAASLALAAAPAVAGVARQEVVLPSRLDVPLFVRVVEGSLGPVVLVVLLLLVGELVYSRLGRELLLRRSGLAPGDGWRGSLLGAVLLGLARMLRHPLDVALAEVGGWLALGVPLLLALALLATAWPFVETAYLPGPGGNVPLTGSFDSLLGLALVVAITLAFVALVIVSLALLGGGAAVRGALLTGGVLHGRSARDWTDGRD